ASAPIAGIVLLSDGEFNRGESPAIVAQVLNQRQLPVFAIGIGDPATPINARITRVSAPRTTFKNDPFSVTVQIDVQGLQNQPLTLELYEQLEGGARKQVESRTVQVDAEARVAPVVFERKVQKPGSARYVARLAPTESETLLADNEKELSPSVRILDDKMKVLLIAGSPSYDYRFLARLFERDKTVEVSTWLQSADAKAVRDGDQVIAALPDTFEEVNQYDAIMLMDCDPAEFDPTWGSMIATYVSDYGGGLLYAAGNKYTARFLRNANLRSLIDTLPVSPDPEAELVVNELGHYQTRAWPILIPPDAAGDAILRQSDDSAQTATVWAALGGVFWHYPVLRGKPVAKALMRHSNPRMVNAFGPHVLFATQFVGTGRTAWLGLNSTWRWRRADEKHFNRFWIQTLRFLVEGKLLGGRARGQILTGKDEYELGENVVATVRALDEQFSPLVVPELELQVSPAQSHGQPEAKDALGDNSAGGPRNVELFPVIGQEGYYEGRFVADMLGAVRLTVSLPGAIGGESGGADRRLEKELEISRSDIEMRNTAMNREALRQFVAETGGRSAYFEVNEARQVPEKVPDMSRTFTVRGRPRAIWDNSTVLVLLVGLLTVEWILRKRAKLL
ncbi:MAG TPA: hypothetical protein VNT79_07930, partial [Phycisphaerae bacterium]|nr:hypothetical protein [Phycisphaerae bacterium]